MSVCDLVILHQLIVKYFHLVILHLLPINNILLTTLKLTIIYHISKCTASSVRIFKNLEKIFFKRRAISNNFSISQEYLILMFFWIQEPILKITILLQRMNLQIKCSWEDPVKFNRPLGMFAHIFFCQDNHNLQSKSKEAMREEPWTEKCLEGVQ